MIKIRFFPSVWLFIVRSRKNISLVCFTCERFCRCLWSLIYIKCFLSKINLNVGNAFDARHGIFTAPVHGLYEFTTAILVPGGKHTGMEIVKNGMSVAKTQSGDSSYYTMGTNVVALDLKAGKIRYTKIRIKSTISLSRVIHYFFLFCSV